MRTGNKEEINHFKQQATIWLNQSSALKLIKEDKATLPIAEYMANKEGITIFNIA